MLKVKLRIKHWLSTQKKLSYRKLFHHLKTVKMICFRKHRFRRLLSTALCGKNIQRLLKNELISISDPIFVEIMYQESIPLRLRTTQQLQN